MKLDPYEERVCEALAAADPCILGVALVHRYGSVAFSMPASLAEHALALSKLVSEMFVDEMGKRSCLSAKLDDVLSCMGVDADDGRHALIVVFFDEPALVCRLPRLMAEAIAELRNHRRHSRRPPDGGSGGTPSEARAFVTLEDREDDA